MVRSYTRRSHGRHPANQRATSARKDKSKPSPASLRIRGRGEMPDAKSGRVHILLQLGVTGGVAAEDTGNHFLLRLTRRSQRCRSGSEISKARFYQRQGARGRCGSVEGRWLLNDLKKEFRRPVFGAYVRLHELSQPRPLMPVIRRKLASPAPQQPTDQRGMNVKAAAVRC